MQKQWDNKFGLMDKPHHEFDDLIKEADELKDNYSQRMKEQQELLDSIPDVSFKKVVIEGVGRDAEIVTNEKGGKQSKSPMAMHLVDPVFLMNWAYMEAKNFEYEDEATEDTVVDVPDREKHSCYEAIYWIARFMDNGDKSMLQYAFDELEDSELQQVIRIAKVLQIGASRYAPNNWRLIPQEEHINHALIHIIAHLAGDRQDEHIDHALCRLMMAYATKKSEGFNYGEFICS